MSHAPIIGKPDAPGPVSLSSRFQDLFEPLLSPSYLIQSISSAGKRSSHSREWPSSSKRSMFVSTLTLTYAVSRSVYAAMKHFRNSPKSK